MVLQTLATYRSSVMAFIITTLLATGLLLDRRLVARLNLNANKHVPWSVRHWHNKRARAPRRSRHLFINVNRVYNVAICLLSGVNVILLCSLNNNLFFFVQLLAPLAVFSLGFRFIVSFLISLCHFFRNLPVHAYSGIVCDLFFTAEAVLELCTNLKQTFKLTSLVW